MKQAVSLLLVGLAAGWIASRLVGGANRGVLGTLAVGVAGAFVGGFVFRLVGFTRIVFPATLVPAVVGAVLCLAAVRYLNKRP